jgi:hypothetical protein
VILPMLASHWADGHNLVSWCAFLSCSCEGGVVKKSSTFTVLTLHLTDKKRTSRICSFLWYED